MGWLTPGMAAHMLNNLAPSREAIADTLGVPMDGVAWAARTLGGAKGIPGGYGEPDPLTQIFNSVLHPGKAQQQIWKPGDVPLSSANIRSLLDQYIPPGGFF